MKSIHLTVHPPVGDVLTAQLTTDQYTVGSAAGAQIQLPYEGVAEQHMVLWVQEDRVQVEPLMQGVQVNSYPIEERVEAEFPVSVEFAGVMLVLELKAVEEEQPAQPEAWKDIQITLPPKEGDGSKGNLPLTSDLHSAVTVVSPWSGPQRPAGSGKHTKTPQPARKIQPVGEDKALLTGEYKLVREIARGGMGKIYFGEDPQLKREVAVKVSILAYGGTDPRFSKEAEVLAQLAHPNIVPVYNIGKDGQGRPFYAMKLVKGRTLQAVLNALAKRDPEVVREYTLPGLLTIFRKVCDAMSFAHSKRILHRDLKPENIMVGEYGEVLVMDWGLAKTLGSEEDRSGHALQATQASPSDMGMTMEGDVMGTPQYMSPEQAEGIVADLDERSDIYSLGGILYAILTLRAPIDGKTLDEVLTKVKSGGISSMSTRRGGNGKVAAASPAVMERNVPEALQAVTLKAMALDRSERYANVEGFAADIERYQNGFATQAENAGAIRQLVLFIKRNKAVSSSVALFLMAAVGFVVKLAASERMAISEMEKSRREAAKAQVTLAEAAEEMGDAEQMRLALSKVPGDLRDLTWEYLDEKSDFADFKIPPPDDSDWMEVENCADDPESVLAVQTNGQLSVINTLTGKVTPLWRAERKGFSLHSIAASADGRLLAVVWRKEDILEVEVRGLRDGKSVGSPTVARLDRSNEKDATARRGTIVELSSKALLVTSYPGGIAARLEAWEVAGGRRLWERDSIRCARFSKDEQSVLGLNNKLEMEKISVADGTTLSKDERGVSNATEPGFPANTKVGLDGSFLISSAFFGANRSLRRFDFPGAMLAWESHLELGRSMGVHVGKDSEVLANLQMRSRQGWLLALYQAKSGALVGSYPFLVKSNDDYRMYRRIAFSEGAVAMAVRKRVMVWRTAGSVQPTAKVGPPTGRFVLDGSQLLYAKPSRSSFELTLHDRNHTKITSLPVQGMSSPSLSLDRSGSRGALRSISHLAAFRVKEGAIEEVWSPKKIDLLSGEPVFAIHPSGDRIWVNDKVLEFSSGRELTTLKMNKSKFAATGRDSKHWAMSGVWVGMRHIVVPMLDDSKTGSDQLGDALLVLWNAETGQMEAKTPAPRLASLSVSSDGQWIVEGGTDKRVRIRNGRDLSVEREIRVHDDAVSVVTWHPSLPLFVTSAKGIVRIWSSQTWRKVEELRVSGFVEFLEISASGNELMMDTPRGMVVYEPESFRK